VEKLEMLLMEATGMKLKYYFIKHQGWVWTTILEDIQAG
jgi:hypothetical protein